MSSRERWRPLTEFVAVTSGAEQDVGYYTDSGKGQVVQDLKA